MGAKAIIGRYSTPLVNHATYMLGGDRSLAEDKVQMGFVKLWQKAGELLSSDRELQLKAWLYRVVHNLCLDELKRKGGHSDLDEVGELVDGQMSVQKKLEGEERAKFVMQLIERLPDRQKSVLLMAHFEDMSNPQIADVMECSVEAVENLLSRARRSLRGWAQDEEVVV